MGRLESDFSARKTICLAWCEAFRLTGHVLTSQPITHKTSAIGIQSIVRSWRPWASSTLHGQGRCWVAVTRSERLGWTALQSDFSRMDIYSSGKVRCGRWSGSYGGKRTSTSGWRQSRGGQCPQLHTFCKALFLHKISHVPINHPVVYPNGCVDVLSYPCPSLSRIHG